MSTNLRIDGKRLVSRLAALSRIGATPEGGCRRLALSDEDKAVLADVTASATMSLNDSHGNILAAIAESLDKKVEVSLTLSK